MSSSSLINARIIDKRTLHFTANIAFHLSIRHEFVECSGHVMSVRGVFNKSLESVCSICI